MPIRFATQLSAAYKGWKDQVRGEHRGEEPGRRRIGGEGWVRVQPLGG